MKCGEAYVLVRKAQRKHKKQAFPYKQAQFFRTASESYRDCSGIGVRSGPFPNLSTLTSPLPLYFFKNCPTLSRVTRSSPVFTVVGTFEMPSEASLPDRRLVRCTMSKRNCAPYQQKSSRFWPASM